VKGIVTKGRTPVRNVSVFVGRRGTAKSNKRGKIGSFFFLGHIRCGGV